MNQATKFKKIFLKLLSSGKRKILKINKGKSEMLSFDQGNDVDKNYICHQVL
jgi:hypothetical protein